MIACRSCGGSEPVLGPAKTGPGGPARSRRGAPRHRPVALEVAGKYSRLCDWVEENIEETLSYFRLPLAHHKHMKSTNRLERLNQELKRRTHVVRIFPNADSCLRLVRALAVEIHENWLEALRYLNMKHLSEHKKGKRCGCPTLPWAEDLL